MQAVTPAQATTGPLQLPLPSQINVMSFPYVVLDPVTVPQAVRSGLCWQVPLLSHVLLLQGPPHALSQQTLPEPELELTQEPLSH